MANPFSVEPANPLAALMSGVQGYDRAKKQTAEDEMMAGRKEAMVALQGGGDLRNPLAKLIGIGDVKGAEAIATFAHQQQQGELQNKTLAESSRHNTVLEGIQRTNSGIQQQLANRKEITPGFQENPDVPGAWRPVTGGPEDPVQIRAKSEAKGLKPLPQNTVHAIGESGNAVTTFNRLTDTFQPDFAGKVVGAVGSLQNLAGRNLPGGLGYEKQAQWWQDYQEQKNIVRNKLFGSALTKTEAGEFEKAAINPGMTEEAIRANLQRQNDAAKRGAAKLAGYYIKAGYDPDHIETALGIPLSDVGVKSQARAPSTPRGGGAAGGASGTPVDWRTYFGAQ